MAQGIGNAIVVSVLLLGLLHCENVWAATCTVGDAGGWTFNVVGWPNGKTFKTGDVLVFNYNPTEHNVVAVDKQGYDTCTVSEGSKTYQTGSDKITLVNGQNYFICGFAGHCGANLKIVVNAL